jgi:hypothetical protein
MNLVIFLITLSLCKLLLAPYFPLIGDEAYYWLWSQHLDLSYVDHPPLIAYVNYILTALFGGHEMVIRIGAILILLLISIIIYQTGKELYGPRAGAIAAVIFNLLPTFFAGGLFLVPQTLLFLFWSLSFFLLVKIVKTGRSGCWYFLGISAGLGLLSDYVMALFFFGAVLYLLVDKENRFWFGRKEPYLAVLISTLLFSPVIIWNLKLGFTPLFYWGGKMGISPRILDNLVNFFGLQMALYTPPLFLMMLYLVFHRGWNNFLMKIFSAVVFLPFLIISPLMNVAGHWISTAYLPSILASSRSKKMTIGLIIFFALLVNATGIAYYFFFYPVPDALRGREMKTNAELPAFLSQSAPKQGRTYYFANDLGMIGLVSFYGKQKVYMAPGRLRQVDLWGKPALQKGDNVLYFALNETTLCEKLKPLFKKVWIEPRARLFNRDADLPTKTQIFHCEGYKGGVIP